MEPSSSLSGNAFHVLFDDANLNVLHQQEKSQTQASRTSTDLNALEIDNGNSEHQRTIRIFGSRDELGIAEERSVDS